MGKWMDKDEWLKAQARILRKRMTRQETALWGFLKNRGLGYRFRHQKPKCGYILDFYCARLKLAIEVDGGYHDQQDQRIKDVHRELELQRMGIFVLRIRNAEIDHDLPYILELIKKVCEERKKDRPNRHVF